jgi:hypothetical protein
LVATEDENVLARRAGDSRTVRHVFERMPLGQAGLAGPQHTCTAANAAYRAIAGRADVIGRTFREVFPDVEGQRV